MSCPYYGKHAAPGIGVVPQGGNQCALILEAFSPCRMETAGRTPDFAQCEFNGSARAAEIEQLPQLAGAFYQRPAPTGLHHILSDVVTTGPDGGRMRVKQPGAELWRQADLEQLATWSTRSIRSITVIAHEAFGNAPPGLFAIEAQVELVNGNSSSPIRRATLVGERQTTGPFDSRTPFRWTMQGKTEIHYNVKAPQRLEDIADAMHRMLDTFPNL